MTEGTIGPQLGGHSDARPGLELTDIERQQIINRAIAILIELAEEELANEEAETAATGKPRAKVPLAQQQWAGDN